MLNSLIRKELNFLDHACGVILIVAFVELFNAEVARELVSSEEGEEEGKLGLLEEFVLRSLAVEVHRVADKFVGHGRIQEESVGLGVAVTEEKHFEHV